MSSLKINHDVVEFHPTLSHIVFLPFLLILGGIFLRMTWLLARLSIIAVRISINKGKQLHRSSSDLLKKQDKAKKMRLVVTFCYTRLPLNALSRAWGAVHQVELPIKLRAPVYRFYIWMYGCQLHEAEEQDLAKYSHLSAFFRRSIKRELRPLCEYSQLVSPVDGHVLSMGQVSNGQLEQVKGVNYTLQGFLGPIHSNDCIIQSNGTHMSTCPPTSVFTDELQYQNMLKTHSMEETSLFFCVIYLSPGDYHRFHSPTDWNVLSRRHFTGKLMSVNPHVACVIQNLFTLNERVSYFGNWQEGFFSYTAVGATNVGSINVFCDPQLMTNQKRQRGQPPYGYEDLSFSSSLQCQKGELFGEFNLGSTIVLVFEAKKDFCFTKKIGEKVLLGQAL